jgi:membrane associated rhomboid family serine protease
MTRTLRMAPWATYGLMALVALVYLFVSTLGSEEREMLLLRWAAIPLEITEQDLPPLTPPSTAATLVTSLFLHANLPHLAANLLYLWVFGGLVERTLGRPGFLGLYLLGGVLGGLAQVAAYPSSLVPVMGASGAVAGVMAAHLVLAPRLTLQALVFGVWLLLQLEEALRAPAAVQLWVGGAALWSHLGGLLAGTLAAMAWRLRGGVSRPSPIAPAKALRGTQIVGEWRELYPIQHSPEAPPNARTTLYSGAPISRHAVAAGSPARRRPRPRAAGSGWQVPVGGRIPE